MKILAALLGFSSLVVLGCASEPFMRPAPQAPPISIEAATTKPVPPIADDDYVVTTTEEWPQVGSEPLPSGNFAIIAKSQDKVPRVELVMSDGPARGQRFTCNLVTGPYPQYKLEPECSGGQEYMHESCVDRTTCFQAFDCGCEK